MVLRDHNESLIDMLESLRRWGHSDTASTHFSFLLTSIGGTLFRGFSSGHAMQSEAWRGYRCTACSTRCSC